jgi:hypothetical protein
VLVDGGEVVAVFIHPCFDTPFGVQKADGFRYYKWGPYSEGLGYFSGLIYLFY